MRCPTVIVERYSLQYSLFRTVHFGSSSVKLQVSLKIFVDFLLGISGLRKEKTGPVSQICCYNPHICLFLCRIILFFLLTFVVFLVTSCEFSFKVHSCKEFYDDDGV